MANERKIHAADCPFRIRNTCQLSTYVDPHYCFSRIFPDGIRHQVEKNCRLHHGDVTFKIVDNEIIRSQP